MNKKHFMLKQEREQLKLKDFDRQERNRTFNFFLLEKLTGNQMTLNQAILLHQVKMFGYSSNFLLCSTSLVISFNSEYMQLTYHCMLDTGITLE